MVKVRGDGDLGKGIGSKDWKEEIDVRIIVEIKYKGFSMYFEVEIIK